MNCSVFIVTLRNQIMSNSVQTPCESKLEWTQAADKAKEAAASMAAMASHAASAVGGSAGQVASDIGKKADDLTANVGVRIQGLGDQLSSHTPHDGMLGTVSQAVAKTVKDGGQYIEQNKLSGMSCQAKNMISNNPITSVLLAVGMGWLIARQLDSKNNA
jgi:hypothetical protein